MSIAVLKRKTMNGNPRLAPISGSNNGTFGFSLNGTRRNIGRIGEHLAPGGMTGPAAVSTSNIYEAIGSTPRINGHASSCCTNDTSVVKPSVINTRGMLSRRLNCLTAGKEACTNCTSCEVGNPPYGCYNWVKKPLYSGEQGQYIERVVRANFKSKTGFDCHETKYGPNGLFIDLSCNKPICECIHKPQQAGWTAGVWPCTRQNLLTMAKPGIRTVDYSTYMHKGLMKKNCLPQTGHYLKPWVLNSSKAECRDEPSTCICGHEAINNGCAPNDSTGSSVWISYDTTGEPYVNMKFGPSFYYAFSAAIGTEWDSGVAPAGTTFTPTLRFVDYDYTFFWPTILSNNHDDPLELSASISTPTYIWTTPLSRWVWWSARAVEVNPGVFAKKHFTHCNISSRLRTDPFWADVPGHGASYIPFPSPYICPSNQ